MIQKILNVFRKPVRTRSKTNLITLTMNLADGNVWEIRRMNGTEAVIRNTDNDSRVVSLDTLVRLPELVDTQYTLSIGEDVNKLCKVEDVTTDPDGEIKYRLSGIPLWVSLETVLEVKKGGE